MRQATRERLSIAATVLSASTAILSALAMRDHLRLVEILGLFASGAGTGAGIAFLVASRARRSDVRAPDAGVATTSPDPSNAVR
jgi:hypothetical protein